MTAASTTILCGSLSKYPVSLGAAMHRAGYEALGLDYVYVPFRCGDLAGALAGMRALGIRGFGVSMPFKQEILPLLDALDPLAERIGAANTVVNAEGRLVGHNTDAEGAVRALREHRDDLSGASALVVGAGGAARAVVHGLAAAGVRVHVVNRTAERARALAAEVPGVTAGGLDADASLADIVVNASSAGMAEYGPAPPIDASQLSARQIVMDIVYKPLATELLAAARARGAATVHGGRMLLHQACRQFELYTACPAPLDAMDAALRSAIRDG